MKKNSTVLESNFEIIDEGFVGTIIDKIKELIRKFIDWCKNLFSSIKNLFSKKCKNGEDLADKTNKKIKYIEQNPDLSEEEKDKQKQSAIKPLLTSNNDNTSSTNNSNNTQKLSTNNSNNTQKLSTRKYEYMGNIMPASAIIRSAYFKDYDKIIETIINRIEDNTLNNYKIFEYYDKKLSEIKFDKTAIEYFNDFKSNVTITRELTPEQVVKIYEQNIDHYKRFEKYLNNLESENNKLIKKLKKIANGLNKKENNKGLTTTASLINKVTKLSQNYLKINMEILGLYGKNLKLKEVE